MIPTFEELYISVQSDLKNKLGTTSVIGKVVVNALSLVQAAKLKLFYLRSAFIYKNIFPDTSDPENLGGTLERFGFVKLGRYPASATAGEYTVSVTGEIGATIPQNTTFKSLDTSSSPDKIYVLDTVYTFTATTGTISLRSLELGSDSALIVTDQLQVTQPIANVNSFVEVVSVDVTPLEAEDSDVYRAKTIQAYRTESQGGAKSDYKFIWALDAQGVVASYSYVKEPGVIDLYVEAAPDDSIDGNGTPSQAILDDVEAVVEFDPDITKPLEERGRRPMGTFQINFLPIIALPVDVVITNLSDTSFLTSISDAIGAYLTNIRPFVDGADNPNSSQKGLLYEADIYGIVRDVLGNSATFQSLTVDVNGSWISIYEFTGGNIPYINSVTNV